MKKLLWLIVPASVVLAVLAAQQRPADITGNISKLQELPKIAIPDFRGAGDAQKFMAAFNETLAADVKASGQLKLISKSMMPVFIPQQPSDFVTPAPVQQETAPRKRGRPAPPPQPTNGGGHWIADWSTPPSSANYLAFGYTAVQNGVFVLRGWLFDVSKPEVSSAQMIAKTYLASVDEAGARKTAHEFATDIIALFGGKSMFGSHIYYVHRESARSTVSEIWRMDPDGGNAVQLTRFGITSLYPAVSGDGSKFAFSSNRSFKWDIFVFSVDPRRDLRFYNPNSRMNSQPSFTPDGKQIVFMSTAGTDKCCRIFVANLDGSGLRPLTSSVFIDAEPKVNPKTGADIVFSSGRSGPEQIYKMNIDGGDVERLSDGTGEAANPAWHPNGQKIAFAWTRGFAAGKFNIFIMDVTTRSYNQLTHDEGKNENPSWAPDGIHLAFMSNRTGTEQIWTMLADGSQPQQITKQGVNSSPVWGM
jgi:TolB protein